MQETQRQPPTPSSDEGSMFPHKQGGPVAVASPALKLLTDSARVRSSLLSIGLEPCAAYLPPGFTPDLKGYERFLKLIIESTSGLAAAYKFNLAFFEALGPAGAELLYRVRAMLPDDVLIIADAKRGDIGSTAEHYARALYEDLRAHSATVNPLMGRDAAEPFLAYADKLTFFLVLTSNPGAADFLLRGGLYRAIAESIVKWNVRSNAGFVVGATNPSFVSEVRAIAGTIPFLVPGVGAQGGELEATARSGAIHGAPSGFPGLLFHLTRGILPGKETTGDAGEFIRLRADEWRHRVNRAVSGLSGAPTTEGGT